MSGEFAVLLRAKLSAYPKEGIITYPREGSGPAAGEGVGGGEGADHPAAKLVHQEVIPISLTVALSLHPNLNPVRPRHRLSMAMYLFDLRSYWPLGT